VQRSFGNRRGTTRGATIELQLKSIDLALVNLLDDLEVSHSVLVMQRIEAAERLRSLVSKIVLTPDGDGKRPIDVQGDLARILAIALAKAPRRGADGAVSQAKLVAGKAQPLRSRFRASYNESSCGGTQPIQIAVSSEFDVLQPMVGKMGQKTFGISNNFSCIAIDKAA
jgi:hypothetical protein